MKKFKDLEKKRKMTHWLGRDGTKLTRLVDIQDPDTGYNLVKKHYKRSTGFVDGFVTTDSSKIKQPKLD